MKRKRMLDLAAAALIASSAFATAASASTVVVNNDEWTLSDTGFAQSATTGQFVSNLVAEFGTTIHAYSNNFSFTGASLATAMTNAGATYTTGTAFSFTLANISAYDAILLGGDYLSASELTDLSAYVAAGGNVYIAGGTGILGPALEAAAWNPFIAAYGVQMNTVYNGITGNISVSGDSLFAGVSTLYQQNGNGLFGASVVCCGQDGLYTIYRTPATIPLPAAGWLLVAGLGSITALRRRKHN